MSVVWYTPMAMVWPVRRTFKREVTYWLPKAAIGCTVAAGGRCGRGAWKLKVLTL